MTACTHAHNAPVTRGPQTRVVMLEIQSRVDEILGGEPLAQWGDARRSQTAAMASAVERVIEARRWRSAISEHISRAY